MYHRGCMILLQQSNSLTLLMKMNLSGLIFFLLFCVSAAEQRQVVSLLTNQKINHLKRGKVIFQLLFFSDENYFIRMSPTTPRQDNVSTTTSTSSYSSSSLYLYFKQAGPLQVRSDPRCYRHPLSYAKNTQFKPKAPMLAVVLGGIVQGWLID